MKILLKKSGWQSLGFNNIPAIAEIIKMQKSSMLSNQENFDILIIKKTKFYSF